mgnify:CR=1 FL=1
MSLLRKLVFIFLKQNITYRITCIIDEYADKHDKSHVVPGCVCASRF